MHVHYREINRLCVFLLILCVIQALETTTVAGSKTKKIVVTADREKDRDKVGYEAIRALHRQMDDDKSGSIDRAESTGFLKEDMHIAEADQFKRREKAFHHGNDDSITVDDLWESWFDSEERQWSVDQAIHWLSNHVQLPQYAGTFEKNAVDGEALPRLAVPESTFVQSVLGIKNPVHRQKIQLKALDLVLFGFKDGSNRLKDALLALLCIGLVTILSVFAMHKRRAAKELAQLSEKMNELQSLENDFQTMQETYEEQKRITENGKLIESESCGEIESLRSQLMEYERRLERSGIGCAPLVLQPMLRKTCELEMSYIAQQRLDCIKEMREAMEEVEKLRRKQSSLVSSLKLATGSGSGTEDLDQRISRLKQRMEHITRSMEECQQRWVEIESLCGFPIVGTPPSGTTVSGGGGGTASVGMTTDEGELPTTTASSSCRPPPTEGVRRQLQQQQQPMLMNLAAGRMVPVMLPPGAYTQVTNGLIRRPLVSSSSSQGQFAPFPTSAMQPSQHALSLALHSAAALAAVPVACGGYVASSRPVYRKQSAAIPPATNPPQSVLVRQKYSDSAVMSQPSSARQPVYLPQQQSGPVRSSSHATFASSIGGGPPQSINGDGRHHRTTATTPDSIGSVPGGRPTFSVDDNHIGNSMEQQPHPGLRARKIPPVLEDVGRAQSHASLSHSTTSSSNSDDKKSKRSAPSAAFNALFKKK